MFRMMVRYLRYILMGTTNVYPFYETQFYIFSYMYNLYLIFLNPTFFGIPVNKTPQDYRWLTNVLKDLNATICMCLPIQIIGFPCRVASIGRHLKWVFNPNWSWIVWPGFNHFPLKSYFRIVLYHFNSTRSQWDEDTDDANKKGERSHWRWSESPEVKERRSRNRSRSSSKSKRNHIRNDSKRSHKKRKRSRSRTRKSRSPQRKSRMDSNRSTKSHSRPRSTSRHRRSISSRREKRKSRRSRTPSISDSKSIRK